MARLSYSIIENPTHFGRNGNKEGTIMLNDGKEIFFVFGQKIHGQDLTIEVECSSGKAAYPTYEAAEKALRMKSPHGQNTKRIYKCRECGCYHFTTVDSQLRKPHPYKRSAEKQHTELLTRAYRGHSGSIEADGFSMKRFRNTQSRMVAFI